MRRLREHPIHRWRGPPSPCGEGLYGSGFAAFFIGRCPKVAFKSRVTSHNNDTSSPLEKGRAKGAGWIHVAV